MKWFLLVICLFVVGCDESPSPIKKREFEYYQVRSPQGQVWWTHKKDIRIESHYAHFTSVGGDDVWIIGDYILQSNREGDLGQIDYQRGLEKPRWVEKKE